MYFHWLQIFYGDTQKHHDITHINMKIWVISEQTFDNMGINNVTWTFLFFLDSMKIHSFHIDMSPRTRTIQGH